MGADFGRSTQEVDPRVTAPGTNTSGAAPSSLLADDGHGPLGGRGGSTDDDIPAGGPAGASADRQPTARDVHGLVESAASPTLRSNERRFEPLVCVVGLVWRKRRSQRIWQPILGRRRPFLPYACGSVNHPISGRLGDNFHTPGLVFCA